jgi:hypothetical protein
MKAVERFNAESLQWKSSGVLWFVSLYQDTYKCPLHTQYGININDRKRKQRMKQKMRINIRPAMSSYFSNLCLDNTPLRAFTSQIKYVWLIWSIDLGSRIVKVVYNYPDTRSQRPHGLRHVLYPARSMDVCPRFSVFCCPVCRYRPCVGLIPRPRSLIRCPNKIHKFQKVKFWIGTGEDGLPWSWWWWWWWWLPSSYTPLWIGCSNLAFKAVLNGVSQLTTLFLHQAVGLLSLVTFSFPLPLHMNSGQCFKNIPLQFITTFTYSFLQL